MSVRPGPRAGRGPTIELLRAALLVAFSIVAIGILLPAILAGAAGFGVP